MSRFIKRDLLTPLNTRSNCRAPPPPPPPPPSVLMVCFFMNPHKCFNRGKIKSWQAFTRTLVNLISAAEGEDDPDHFFGGGDLNYPLVNKYTCL